MELVLYNTNMAILIFREAMVKENLMILAVARGGKGEKKKECKYYFQAKIRGIDPF